VTSEVPIHRVFCDDPGPLSPSDHMRSVMDELVCRHRVFILPFTLSERATFFFLQGLSDQVAGNSSIFTGEEEVFAFQRACSRLVQMGSREWAETAGQS
jgi:protein AFG1